MKKGFTLIEMLVSIGIIVILMAAVAGVYSGITKAADRARCQDLVSNVATALTQLFQKEGAWPKALIEGRKRGLLDEETAWVLGKKGYLPLTVSSDGTRLSGYDRFGIVTPWAAAYIKNHAASPGDKLPGGGTLSDHILHYDIDLDGDGIISDASVGGAPVDVRATAIVWCCGKDGVLSPYAKGIREDDVYSWTVGQTVKK